MKTFVFNAIEYPYFNHPYNRTWTNERTVEVPIFLTVYNAHHLIGNTILEVGNVLSHYIGVGHDIVDRYEVAEGVTNEDIVDYTPNKKYDLILSISTLEHIGETQKILQAIKKMRELLTPSGRILFSVPLGYNPEMDQLLGDGVLTLEKKYCLMRVTKSNLWREAMWSECAGAMYGFPHDFGNAIVIGVIKNRGDEPR